MAGQTDISVDYLNPLFKEYVNDNIQKLTTDHEVLYKRLVFENMSPMGGGDYVVRAITSRDHGFTALGNGAQQSPRLNPPVASSVDRASIRPSGYLGRTQIDRLATSRMGSLGQIVGDEQSSQKAREDAVKFLASEISYPSESLLSSGVSILEEMMWYGQAGRTSVGILNNAALPTDFNNTSTTPALNTTSYFFDASGTGITSNANLGTSQAFQSIIFPIQQWASALWQGYENLVMDLYNGNTKIGTLPAISYIDMVNRRVYFESAVSNLTAAVAANATFFRLNFKNMEGQGLVPIFNTQQSVLFGINQAQKSLWSATKISLGSTLLSGNKLINAMAMAYGRGMLGQVSTYCSEKVFSSIIPDFLTAKDQLIQSSATPSNIGNRQGRLFTDGKEMMNLVHGSKSLKFVVMDMEVELMATGYCKSGDLISFPMQTIKRIGSSEPTFEDKLTPGSAGKFFMQLPDYAAFELRLFFDQSPFPVRPNRCLYLSDISI